MRETPVTAHEEIDIESKHRGGFKEEFKAGGWRVIVASAIGVGLGLSGLPFYTLGVFTQPLVAEFGWTRAQVQGALAFMMIGTLLAGGLTGWLADRFGVRRVALCSQIGLAFGLAGLSFTPNSVAMWNLAWLVMAMLGIGTTPVTWTRAIATWFDKGRGFALGVALMGTGITALVAPPLTTKLIGLFGWRMAYLALASAVVVIAIPMVLWLFHEKGDAAHDGSTKRVPSGNGLSLAAALRGYRFWLLMAGFAAISFGVGGLIPNLVPLLTDKGLSAVDAAFYASIIGINVIGGRVVAGYLLDRMWAPLVALIFLSLPALSCVLLAQDLSTPVLIGLSTALIGLAAGAEFDLIAYLCARYFGIRHYSQIYAWQWVSFMLAAGFAPMAFGRVFDATGSYDPILYVAGAGFALGALLLLGLGRYPKFEATHARG